ncbi:hypothetical protein AVEN_26983-1 [Araneus ventricosus]|uniref:Uncharacterized protein n=1 Tax=Araneus ventricosus TaxID=182803 RepID=A0A4Y2EWJ9_ARAVE|nr:hypothetical protein AVEN_26983-1 [Araneus ventricosus]
MPEDTSSQTSPGFPLIQPVRTPSTFHGEAGETPTAWLKEYECIAKFNRWDDTMCLANAYFFLNGTARLWTSSSNKLNKTQEPSPENRGEQAVLHSKCARTLS